jgi:hypothetical protein
MTDHSAEQSGEHPGMNTLLLVPDGVSLRNFILTDLPGALARRGSVDVLFGRGLAQHPAVAEAPIRTAAELLPYPERITEAPFRRTLEYSHLRWCNTEGTRFVLDEPIPGRARSQALRWLARSASSLTSSQHGVLGLVSLHERSAARRPEVDTYLGLLEGWQPDVVLCAHQRPLEVLPVVMAARRLRIPTATFIFSWDNLTTKGRIAAPFDYFMVWSDRMREELLHFYPDVDASRVFVVGSPQFELYADSELTWTRDRLFTELGLDPARKLICYSGGDTRTCPDDPDHLDLLCQLVEDGQIGGDPQIVLRPAPVDTSDRYDAVLQRRRVTLSKPAWAKCADGWSGMAPTRDDLQILAALTQHADVNVNMASTMTLDFALHGTPVVNLGFDMRPERRLAPRYYRFDHYVPVVTFGAARVAGGPAELAGHINAYLRDPSLDRDGRRRFTEFELRIRPGESVASIALALDEIHNRDRADVRPRRELDRVGATS